MSRVMRRLWKKLLCQIICEGITVIRQDGRTGKSYVVVYCKRCQRVLETEEIALPAARTRQKSAA